MSKTPALTGSAGTLPLANTAPTPEIGETVRAEDVQEAVQALLNQDATLELLVPKGVFVEMNALIGGASLETFSTFDGAFHDSTKAVGTMTGLKVGDKIDVSCVFDVQTTASSSDCEFRLYIIQDYGGTNVGSVMDGSYWITRAPTRARTLLDGWTTITVAGTIKVAMQFKIGESCNVDNYGCGCLKIRKCR